MTVSTGASLSPLFANNRHQDRRAVLGRKIHMKPVSNATLIRLEKAAADNGFDLGPDSKQEGWIGFASSRVPLKLWLSTFHDAVYVAAFSQASVVRELGDYGTPVLSPLPQGAEGGHTAVDISSLGRLIRRAFQLSSALPNELLRKFQAEVAHPPKTTEVERLVRQRVGQNIFRAGLLDYWQGRCALTGLAHASVLRASHIKGWAKCDSDEERLDVFNGLLLAPQVDAVFDVGLITFEDDGQMRVSQELSAESVEVLGLVRVDRRVALADGHRRYLRWHREVWFKK